MYTVNSLLQNELGASGIKCCCGGSTQFCKERQPVQPTDFQHTCSMSGSKIYGLCVAKDFEGDPINPKICVTCFESLSSKTSTLTFLPNKIYVKCREDDCRIVDISKMRDYITSSIGPDTNKVSDKLL